MLGQRDLRRGHHVSHRYRAEDEEGLLARHHRVGQWCIWPSV